MGQVVFAHFPRAKVRYTFINRGKTQFPPGFAEMLQYQILLLSYVNLTQPEYVWLTEQPCIQPTYAEWLAGYSFDPSEVKVTQKGGDLTMTIEAPWFRGILWEVPLMAIISELYFHMTGVEMDSDWHKRIIRKAKNMDGSDCLWSDFGTRRRFARMVQDTVVMIMSGYKGFIGTSNPSLAREYHVPVIGTYAHEAVMAMEPLVGVIGANNQWLRTWREYYGKDLSVALTDTFTTEMFFRYFGVHSIEHWEGFRQDSHDEHEWVKKVVNHFRDFEMTKHLKDKKLIFSNNLTDEKYKALSLKYRELATIIGGIGTYLTNDVFTEEQKDAGLKPLNMVIKLSAINFGDGWKGCVKLSDEDGKHTGTPEDIQRVKLAIR